MSIIRLNAIILRDILPFNFGMDYDQWLKFWDNHPTMRALVGSDPRTWDLSTIDRINQKAKKEQELYNRLMALNDDDFYDEIDRLEKEGHTWN